MASFAIQAVQNVMERTSNKRMDQRRADAGDETSPESVRRSDKERSSEGGDPEGGQQGGSKTMSEEVDEMHATLVIKHHAKIPRSQSQPNSSTRLDSTSDSISQTKPDIQNENIRSLLEHAVSLERIARRLLVAHLEEGSRAQILLRADWNLQARDLRALESERKGKDVSVGGTKVGGDKNGGKANGNGIEKANGNGAEKGNGNGMSVTEAGVTGGSGDREEREEAEIAEISVGGMDEEETLKAVREFRRNVAAMLALGSYMRDLEVRLLFF